LSENVGSSIMNFDQPCILMLYIHIILYNIYNILIYIIYT
jgi:hypothetical protein